MARRFRALAREWLDVDTLSDMALAEKARELGIDILIDLGGYGEAARMTACAYRLAPVQIKWVGMQNHSSGLAEMDWIITDRWETPPSWSTLYSERLLRLPDGYVCYSPPPYAPELVPLPALANGHITFGCFNNLAKVTPRVIATWCAILRRVPGSRLVLKTHQFSDETDRGTRARLRFAAHGIAAVTDRAPRRIAATGLSCGEYNDIDIVLDPFPYSGGLTTCEALWMGVPTIAARRNIRLPPFDEPPEQCRTGRLGRTGPRCLYRARGGEGGRHRNPGRIACRSARSGEGEPALRRAAFRTMSGRGITGGLARLVRPKLTVGVQSIAV